MEFIDKFLPFIIMIFWAVIAFRKKKKPVEKPKSKPDSNKKKIFNLPGFENLSKTIENLIETNVIQPPLQKASANDDDEIILESKESKEDPKAQKYSTESQAKLQKSNDPAHMNTFLNKQSSAYDVKIKSKSKYSVKRLREAIIWSEILAKPVSLRNEDSLI